MHDVEYCRRTVERQSDRNRELRAQVRNLRRWNMGLLACVAASGALLIAAGLLL